MRGRYGCDYYVKLLAIMHCIIAKLFSGCHKKNGAGDEPQPAPGPQVKGRKRPRRAPDGPDGPKGAAATPSTPAPPSGPPSDIGGTIIARTRCRYEMRGEVCLLDAVIPFHHANRATIGDHCALEHRASRATVKRYASLCCGESRRPFV